MNLRVMLCCALAVGTALLSKAVDSANLRGNADPDCGSPPAIYQGKASYSSTKHGSRVIYSCNKGCIMSGGSSSLTCSRGTWNGSPPACRVEYLKRNDNTYKSGNTGYILYSE